MKMWVILNPSGESRSIGETPARFNRPRCGGRAHNPHARPAAFAQFASKFMNATGFLAKGSK
jgi:hypothetical protein